MTNMMTPAKYLLSFKTFKNSRGELEVLFLLFEFFVLDINIEET
jgi:hypothetical protein